MSHASQHTGHKGHTGEESFNVLLSTGVPELRTQDLIDYYPDADRHCLHITNARTFISPTVQSSTLFPMLPTLVLQSLTLSVPVPLPPPHGFSPCTPTHPYFIVQAALHRCIGLNSVFSANYGLCTVHPATPPIPRPPIHPPMPHPPPILQKSNSAAYCTVKTPHSMLVTPGKTGLLFPWSYQ